MTIPDWLWQGLVEDAVWWGIAFSAAWAWKNRERIRHRLERNRKTVTISMNPANLTAEATPVLVSAAIQAKSTVKATATVENTPSLARQLEELAAWYLHVS
jgi:ketosteroid isomerase-like protein